MRPPITSFALLTSIGLASCSGAAPEPSVELLPITEVQDLSGYQKAYFGAGCFWVEEAMFESLNGVGKVVSGYCGGTTADPTYEQVCTGRTGHAETVEVYYDPKVIDYNTLLKVFFGSQDPTTVDRQGPDAGTQYRSVIFTSNATEKAQAEAMIAELNKSGAYGRPIVTQVTPFEHFWTAEDYHQGYERLHPDEPYVATVSKSRYDAFAARFRDLLK